MPKRWKNSKLIAGPNGWAPWTYPRHDGYRMACCDCGLVHTIDFRIDTDGPLHTLRGDRLRRANGHVKMRVARDNRSTAMLRRYHEPTLNKTFLHHASDSLIALYSAYPEELARFLRNFRAKVRQNVKDKATL